MPAQNVISPLPSDVHVNRPMTQISLAYMQDQSVFMASSVFPNVPVLKQSDFWFSFPKGTFYKNRMKVRGLSERSPIVAFAVQQDTPYNCVVKSLAEPIDDRLRANTDDPINLDQVVSLQLTYNALIEREQRWITSFFGSGIWTGDYTGQSANPTGSQFLQWNDAASDPIGDVRRARSRAHLASGGRKPNVMVMPMSIYDVLVEHPDVIERVKFSTPSGQPARVTKEILAALFEVDRIVVCEAIADTSADGPATTASLAYICPKHVGLFYVTPAPSLMSISAGLTFTWTGYLGATDMGTRIARWREQNIKSDMFEIESAYDMKLVAADAGTMLLNAIA